MDIGPILIMLVVLLILARIGSRIFAKFGTPGLIGEIIIGVVIANLTIGDWSFLSMLDIQMDPANENYEVLELFAELGVIFLLFSVGLETRVSDLMSVGKAAMLVATLGVIVPFVLGFAVIEVTGDGLNAALFMAAAMVATSVGITARVIKDMKLIDTKEARIIIGAAVIDDILGMIVLAVVIGMSSGTGGGIDIGNVILVSAMAVAFVLLTIAAAKFVVPKIYDYFKARSENRLKKTGEAHSTVNKLILALVTCLFFAWIADSIGLAAIIGAFLGGMLLADHAWEWELESKVESIMTLFLSFFFLNVGMQINLSECASWTVIGLAIVVILLAVVSKYIGCGLGARLGDKTLDKASINIIGVGMIPRGEVGIIVAAYGLQHGVLSDDLYAVVIVMAVATTIIAPPLLSKAFRKKYPEEYKITPDDV
jgi:Kef-type K+ transport system membrane component KefB